MKILKIWILINIFISTFYAQQINKIIPLKKDIYSINIIGKGENILITYKNKGLLYVIEKDGSFPGKNISGIDSLIIRNNYFIAKKNKYWGVLDFPSNEFLIPPVYDNIVPIENTTWFYAGKYGATTVIDASNNKIIPFKPNNIFYPGKKVGRLGKNIFIYDYKEKHKYHIATIPENYKFENDKNPVDLFVLNKDVFLLKYKDPYYWELYKSGKNKVRLEIKGYPVKAYTDGIVFRKGRRTFSLIDYDVKKILSKKTSLFLD